MKKLISSVLFCSLLPSVAMANCDFKTGITPNSDGSYRYTAECHLKVGNMKQDLEIKDQQIEKYVKALELKDLAIVKADERWALWRDTSYGMQDRLIKYDDLRQKNQLLYFAAGVILTGFAVWGAGQLR